jgi:hypothetical protein
MKSKVMIGTIFVVCMLMSTIFASANAMQYTQKTVKNKEIGKQSLIEKDNLIFAIKTDKEAYSIGEPVYISLSVTNTGNKTEKITAPSSMTSDFAVFNWLGRKKYQESDGKGYLQVITETKIPAGKTVYFNYTWDQKGAMFPWMPPIFRHQLKTGIYYIGGYIPYEEGNVIIIRPGLDNLETVTLYTKINISQYVAFS